MHSHFGISLSLLKGIRIRIINHEPKQAQTRPINAGVAMRTDPKQTPNAIPAMVRVARYLSVDRNLHDCNA